MVACYEKVANLWTFLALFCLCFFLETITFTFLISAIQSIENQFQIPSKMSGTLVAASDIGYVLFVVILSYFGSRGNRARWIGGGCLLISLGCLVVALPHFIFREASVATSDTTALAKEAFEDHLPPWIDNENLTVQQLLDYPPIKKLPIPPFVKTMLIDKEQHLLSGGSTDADDYYSYYNYDFVPDSTTTIKPTFERLLRRLKRERPKMPTPDPKELAAMKKLVEAVLVDEAPLQDLIEAVRARIKKGPPEAMFPIVTRAAAAPFGRCSPVVNTLKSKITALKCRMNQSNNAAYAIVFVGIMMIGIGHSMPWTLGVPLIDDNVKKRSTPLYFAGVFFIRILGPVLGFLIGGACIRTYFTLGDPPLGLTPMDPRWIGAWWLGFIVVFAALFLPSLLLFFFPDGSRVIEKENEKATYGGVESNVAKKDGKKVLYLTDKHRDKDGDQDISQALKNFLGALGVVIKNPIYMGCLIGRFFDTLAFKGLFVFLPKYLESHYGMPQFKANIYLAVMGVVGFAAGVALGSVIMRKLKLEGRKAAGYIGLISFIGICLTAINLFLGCTSINNKVGRLGVENGFNFENECNRDCNCGPVSMFPVCSASGQAYYSPCVAGCKNMTVIDKMNFRFDFSDCSCIDNGTKVSRDFCKDDCGGMLIAYFVLSVVGGLIGGTSVIPSILMVLRSIPPKHRSIALGFSGFIISLLGTLPSPIVFGYIVDTACILWDAKCGSGTGSCIMYDPSALRYRMFGFQLVLRCCGLIFDVWVFYWAKGLKLMEEEDSPSEHGNNNDANGATVSVAEKLGSINSLNTGPTTT